jgi:hypothetical protein
MAGSATRRAKGRSSEVGRRQLDPVNAHGAREA